MIYEVYEIRGPGLSKVCEVVGKDHYHAIKIAKRRGVVAPIVCTEEERRHQDVINTERGYTKWH